LGDLTNLGSSLLKSGFDAMKEAANKAKELTMTDE
jgi:hypothetical protein